MALDTVHEPPDGWNEVMGNRRKVPVLEIQFQTDAEHSHSADVVAEKLADLPVPGFVHAFLQEAIESPPEHLLQTIDAAKKHMASCDFALLLGKMAHERGQGTLPDAAFAANESYFEPALRAGFHHTVQARDFVDTTDEELNGNGLSRSERARLGIHVLQVSLGINTISRSHGTFDPEG